MLKRVFDLVVATFGIVVLAPVMLFVIVSIKQDSKGPIFFRHTRVGRHGEPFYILKFRTMSHETVGNGPSITANSDARITRIGHVLRRYKLDELPQLFNVVKGDMSLVGPRPEVRQYVDL